ncbi:MAG TPA: ABC transporter substrate-binding protein [Thermomicrobiales bacterium]|jgi:peptide/nickel transport system substrate-binding protein
MTESRNPESASDLLRFILNRRRLLGGAAGAGVAVAGLAGGAGSLRAQEAGGKLTFAIWQSPESLDPAVSGLISAGYVFSQIYEPLIWRMPGIKEGTEFFPGLAESWEVSDDVTTYTFHLRKDVKFHDGTPLKADAIKVAYDHIVDPNTKSASAATALGPYDHTEVVDDYTAKVVFKEPNAAFLNTVANDAQFSPGSPTALQADTAGFGQHPVGTGPFMFKEWVVDDHVTVVKNPDYAWPSQVFANQGQAYLDEVTFRIIPDASTRMNALKTGDVDMAENPPPQDVAQFASDTANYQVYHATTTGMPYDIMINCANPPTDDVKVRQALEFATSQEQIVDALYKGVYEPAHNLFLPGTTGRDDSLNSMYTYNPDKAKQLLDEAGWTLDGDVRKKNGQELKLKFINLAGFGFDDISTLMQAQFQEIGIQTDISAEAFPAVGDTLNNGNGGHNLTDFFYYAPDPFFMRALFACDQVGKGFNWMHYCNADVDKMVTEGNATSDVEKRQEIYAAAAKQVMEDASFIPIYEQAAVFPAKKSVTGLMFTPTGGPLFYNVSVSG